MQADTANEASGGGGDEEVLNYRYRMSGLAEFMKEHWHFEREYWEKKGRTP